MTLAEGPAGLPFRRINFVAARDPGAHSVTPDDKLVPLTEMPSMLPVPPAQAAAAALTAPMSRVADDMAYPAAPYCSENAIQLSWGSPRKAGSGLVNLGNTCFMNAVLQCLTHTPPLAQLCLLDAGLSTSTADKQHMDPIAAMQAHVKKALTAANPVRPMWHAKNLKAINRRFRLGRQEDAHEYLRCVLDAMAEAYLKHLKPKPTPELATTTFIHRIFGGKLRSEIVCEGVDYRSATFDPFLDLSLEITKAQTLTRALQHFTAEEVLDGDNRYRCPKNNKLVRAYKRISIENAPNVLTVHLKRFDFFGRGHKVSKRVEFDMQLDLGPFMTSHLQRRHHHKHKHHHQQQQHHHHHHHHGHHTPVLYDLYGVLVHHGHSLHSGHYVSFVKAGNGIWHHCDDHRVAQVSERMVEAQQAYILFYVRRQPKGAKQAAAAAANNQAAAAALGQAAASAAVAAAAAANREQQRQLQREQLRLQKQQDSSKPAAAGAAAAAAVSAGGQETGSISAAEARKVVTSSTESTANASPAEGDGQQQADAVEFKPQYTPAQLQKLRNHHHHHNTRSMRGVVLPLNSFERHLQIAKEAALSMKLQRRNSKRLSLPNGHNGLEEHSGRHHQHAEQQHIGLLGGSPAKQPRRIKPEAVLADAQQQQQPRRIKPELVQPDVSQQQQQQQEVRPSKRQRQEEQQQPQQVANGQQQQPEPVDAAVDAGQPLKRRKHKDGSSKHHAEQPQAQLPKQPPVQQQQQPQPEHQQPQPQQAHKATAFVAASKQQQVAHVGSTVTGAAALELLMSASRTSKGLGVSGWEGGDSDAAARAAAMQRAAAQQAKRKERDEWDVEYDRGKTKKVRSKAADDDDAAEGGNRFQQAWQQQLPQKARQEAWKGMGDGGQQRRGGHRGGGRSGRGRGRGGGGRGGRRGGFGGGRGGRGGGGGGRGGGFGRGGGRGGFGGGRGRGR